MNRLRKAVIPAGGWGTRCLPASKALPKEMFPVLNKPAIQYAVEEAVQAGIESIAIITGRNKESIENYFDYNPELETYLKSKRNYHLLEKVRGPANLATILFIRQKRPYGLGHAILSARDFIDDEPFTVILPDDLIHNKTSCLKQMIKIYEKHGGSVLAVEQVPNEDISKYGVIAPITISCDLFLIKDLIEKPAVGAAPSDLAIVGRYILQPAIFEHLKHLKPGANGEIQLTDALKCMADEGQIYGYRFKGLRFDLGSPVGLIKANLTMGVLAREYKKDVEKIILTFLENYRGKP